MIPSLLNFLSIPSGTDYDFHSDKEERKLEKLVTCELVFMAERDDGEKHGDKKTVSTVSPYHLNSNDNPGNIITQVQLKGDNYDEWARAMRSSLRAKKKYGFIAGTIPQPDEKLADLEDWWTVNSMLVS
ncbi:hypothetical protein MRB53_006650 [Persea americana]|uniref:Uncharacterized protein n=1 Tax=Persea americana TaxID=3435 RepID=A0ACC2MGS5_PERAE|nr:hypothetical protein MRB53_006650 [Persea americana]